MSHSAPTLGASPHRPGARRTLSERLIPVAIVLSLLVPFAVALFATNGQTRADITFTDRERDGVAYLRPLVRLLSATVDAQNAAVAGRPADGTALQTAGRDVEEIDTRLGAVLGTTDRWDDLSGQLDQLAGSRATAREAYRAYSVVVDLELALIGRVGDTSNLILDPELDAYYVMDATLLRVPALLVDSGKATSLTRLAQIEAGEADRLAGAVSTTTVRSSIAAVDDGLRKSFGTTKSRSLGPELLTPLDRLRDTTTTFAPPAIEVGVTPTERDLAQVDSSRTALRDAALAFESTGLTELDALLAARRDSLAADQRLVFGIALAGVLLAGILAAVSARRSGRLRRLGAAVPEGGPTASEPVPGELVGSGQGSRAARGEP